MIQRVAFLLLVGWTFWSFSAGAQTCPEAHTLVAKINSLHISPKALDDSLSSAAFDQLWVELDPYRIIYSGQDICQSEGIRLRLDDEIQSASCALLERLTRIHNDCLQRLRKQIDSLKTKALAFDDGTVWKIDMAEQHAEKESSRRSRVVRLIKYEALRLAHRMQQLQTGAQSKSIRQLIPEAQSKVCTRLIEEVEDNMHDLRAMTGFFLKAIAHTFDPHTVYFDPDEMQEFEDHLEDEKMSFGILWTESTSGEISVRGLQPGGPAWKSGLIHQGDILVRVDIGDKEPVDMFDYSMEELDELLDAPSLEEAEFHFQRAGATPLLVRLRKEKIANTENSVTGLMLEGTHSIGYIQLPGFFTGEQEAQGHGCAGEVAREIISLKQAGMEGLILDLRYNGGGSLAEAVELAGIFIDAGPVSIFEERDAEPITLKDMNRGVAYAGPLLILVNVGSASASELVAAALQDYHRALIVGSRTFGKATGQLAEPLNPTSSESGYVKVTTSRLYRVTQQSLQQQGVVPDIEMPELFSFAAFGERQLGHSLPPQSTTKKAYFTPGVNLVTEHLKQASLQRQLASDRMTSVREAAQLLSTPIPLHPEKFQEFMSKLNQLIEGSATKRQAVFEVKDRKKQPDALRQLMSEELARQMAASAFIEEAYLILNDWLNNKK